MNNKKTEDILKHLLSFSHVLLWC